MLADSVEAADIIRLWQPYKFPKATVNSLKSCNTFTSLESAQFKGRRSYLIETSILSIRCSSRSVQFLLKSNPFVLKSVQFGGKKVY